MARAKHSKRRSGSGQDKVNFMITLVTVSVVFIFFGYLLGQYAVRVLRDEGVTTINRVQQQDVVSREIPRTLPDPPPAPQPAPTDAAPSATAQQSAPVGDTGSGSAESTPPSTPTPATAEGPSPSASPVASADAGADDGEVRYRVQVGAFSQMANAERIRDALVDAGFPARITDGPLYRVQSGGFASRESAQTHAEALRSAGFEAVINQQ